MASHCFVCGPENPIGLKIQFRLEGEWCLAEFTPGAHHVGYDGVVHGGILFSLLDDVMANGLWLRGERAFTARMDIRYRMPLPVGTRVALQGRVIKRKARLVQTEGKILVAADRNIVAEAHAQFMLQAAV